MSRYLPQYFDTYHADGLNTNNFQCMTYSLELIIDRLGMKSNQFNLAGFKRKTYKRQVGKWLKLKPWLRFKGEDCNLRTINELIENIIVVIKHTAAL